VTATAGGAPGPVEAGRWPSRGPRLWEHPDVRLFAGRHRLPRSVVERIQRDRLIDAMIAVAARLGYQDASVEKVITEAGVSEADVLRPVQRQGGVLPGRIRRRRLLAAGADL
jgi:hypothetical protein